MPTWAFNLIDNLSGPARAADRALEMLDGELRATDKAAQALSKTTKQLNLNRAMGTDITAQQKAHTKSVMDSLRVSRLRLGLQRDEQKAAKDLALEHRKGLGFFANLRSALSPMQAARSKVEELSHSLRGAAQNGGLFRSALSGAGSILAGVATGVAAATAGLVAMGVAFAASTAKAVDFGEAQRSALMGRLGAVEGARQYEILIEYSNRYGKSLQDVFGQFGQLSRAGFNQNDALSLMQAAGDAAGVLGNEAAGRVVTMMTQMAAKGKTQMEELMQGAEAGIPLAEVLAQIAHNRGKTVSEVQRLMQQGQITGREGVIAASQVLTKQFSRGGRAGTGMEAATHTMMGTIDLISARWEIFKTRVGETGAFAPVTAFLGRVAELMDGNTASGQRFQQTLNSMFTGLFGAVGQQDPVQMFQNMAGTIREAGAAAKIFLDIFIQAGKVLGVVADAVNALRPGQGISMDPSLRGVRAGGPSNTQILAARLDEAAGGPAAPAIPSLAPTGAGAAAAAMAQRNVNVGGITVHVDAAGLQSGGATPAEVGQQIADSAHEHLSRQLNSASMSQGNPT